MYSPTQTGDGCICVCVYVVVHMGQGNHFAHDNQFSLLISRVCRDMIGELVRWGDEFSFSCT